jgi:hypothetical protein
MSRFRFELMHPMPVRREGSLIQQGPELEIKNKKRTRPRRARTPSRPDYGPATRIFVPDGQISESCPAPFSKIFLFSPDPNHFYTPRRLVPQGRIAIVTDAGWDAVDAAASGACGDRRAGSDGPVSGRSARGRTAHVADGEVVWSWHPLLVLNRRRQVARPGLTNLNPPMTVAT